MKSQELIRLFEGYPNNSTKVAKETAETIYNAQFGQKKFMGKFSQNNSINAGAIRPLAPVNSTIGNATYSKESTGKYRITIPGAFAEPNKVLFFCSQLNNAAYVVNPDIIDDDTLIVRVSNAGAYTDDILVDVSIMILILE